MINPNITTSEIMVYIILVCIISFIIWNWFSFINRLRLNQARDKK
jgi:hypothetical protein